MQYQEKLLQKKGELRDIASDTWAREIATRILRAFSFVATQIKNWKFSFPSLRSEKLKKFYQRYVATFTKTRPDQTRPDQTTYFRLDKIRNVYSEQGPIKVHMNMET